MANNKSKKQTLDLSDLQGDVSKPLIGSDSHFGLKKEIWDDGQRMADTLPFQVQCFGDLTEEYVAGIIDKAKGSEIQLKHWTENLANLTKYLNNYQKIVEKQKQGVEKISETRLVVAELEKELGIKLAEDEAALRKIHAAHRSSIAAEQESLEISLTEIASKFTEGSEKRQAKFQTDKAAKTEQEQTPFVKQTTDLVSRYKKSREGKLTMPAFGITSRISTAS